jgi:hypothetical protein
MPQGRENYIPRRDAEFAAWVAHFSAAVHQFYEGQGLDPDGLKPFQEALIVWAEDYPAHVAAQQQAEAARAAKDSARAALEAQVRPVARFVQGFPNTTDADRANIGITVRDPSRSAVPPPTSAPAVRVENGLRLTHRVRFTDTASPTRRGKPPGTLGAEVWLALADPGQPAPPLNNPAPASNDRYRFLSLSPRGSLDATFPSSEAGKTAYYALRWVSTRGDKGPWSEVCGATVAA